MRQPNPRDVSAANKPFGRGPRSGRAERYPPPLGRAEQRSSVRIKTLALFERSEFASVPNAASSARNPKGTDVARLFFGYFFLATQKKVTRPPGRDPASHRRKTTPATQTPSLLPQGNHKGCPYDLTSHKGTARRAPTPSPLTKARHAVPLRPHSYALTPTPSLLTPHSSLLRPPPHPGCLSENAPRTAPCW